jgi:tRNA G10  N-methylase Trm11
MKELYRFRQFLAEGVIKENMSIEDVYNDAQKQVKDIYNIDVPMDVVKQWADNYQFPYSREVDPEDEDQYVLVYDFGTEERGDFMEWLKDNGFREDIAEMAYERDSVEDIVKRIKPILANHPQLKKQEDPEQYLIDFVTKRKRFINKNEAPIGKDKFARNIGTMPYDKYIKLQFNEYIYSTTP